MSGRKTKDANNILNGCFIDYNNGRDNVLQLSKKNTNEKKVIGRMNIIFIIGYLIFLSYLLNWLLSNFKFTIKELKEIIDIIYI